MPNEADQTTETDTETAQSAEALVPTDTAPPTSDTAKAVDPSVDTSRDWIQALPEDLRSEGLNKFTQAKDTRMVQVPETTLKAYANLEHHLGKETFAIPETDEQKDIVAEKLGWERDFDEYSGGFKPVDVPDSIEYDNDEEKFLIQLAHEHRVPVETAHSIRDQIAGTRIKALQDAAETRQAYLKDVEEQHDKEFGKDRTILQNRAKAAMEDYGDPGLIELFEHAEYEGRKLGDHPLYFKFMAALGKDKIGSADERGLADTTGGESKEQLQEAIAEIQANKNYYDESHPEQKSLTNKMSRLLRKLHGEM